MAGKEKDGEFNTTVKDHFESTVTNGASANIKKRYEEDEENDICSLLLLPITPDSFRASEMLNFVCEKLSREHENLCQRPVKHGNVLAIQTRVPQAGFLIIQFLDMIGKVVYQDLSQTASMTLNLGRDDFLVANRCKCNDSFSILENILRSGKFQFLIFRTCRGKSCLSTESTTQPVSSEEIRGLDALFIEISNHKNAMNDLLDKTIRTNAVGDSGNAPNSVITDQDFLKELSEIKFQCRKSVEKLRKAVEILKEQLQCGRASSPTIQNGSSEHFNTEQHLPGETSVSRNDISTQSAEQTRNEDSPANHDFSLPTLLSSVSQFLDVADWEKLRYIITQHVPEIALENIENGVELFQLLVNRYLISNANLQFLRDAFFVMGRFDLVHLIDCVKEGDYSLLNNERTTQMARNVTQTQAGYTSINHLDITPLQQMQNLNLRTNPNASHSQTVHGNEPLTMASNATSRDDDKLQRKHRDVPQRPLTSRGYPIQENSANHSDANEDGDNGGSHTARTKAEIDASHDHTTIDSDSRHTGQAMGPDGNTSTTDQSSDGRTTWVNNPVFSCDHYERLCDVQFSCCERFWPCHRCHNSESLCEVKKLRSRDIKIVKCKRCGKEQQFPKENPHCVECNLKFAEYFCAMCQHLTGKQNHPYHCEKCGICRVHGDRSFHCDVCGVCLDVNLRDNHKCRAGSAHDECCICFEDAFNGCQILPCSHKVHKDCATAMLRNGITKCPVCRESFEQRVEHRPIQYKSTKNQNLKG